MMTMVNLAVPTIGSHFGVSAHIQSWTVMAFFLASVAFMIPMSRVSDLYGKKKIFIFGIVVVLLSSVATAASPTFEILLASRAFSGIGTACISLTSVSMIAQVYPSAQKGLPLAINTMCIYIGASLGPGLGGLLTDMFGWRVMFLSIIPFCVLALAMIMRFKYELRTAKGEPFDAKGSLLYGIGIVVLMYGVITLPDALSPIFITAGALLLVVFLHSQMRAKYPVLMLSLFSGRTFRRSTFATFLNYGSAYAVLFSLSLYLQYIGGMGPGTAGLIILAQPAIQAVITPFAGRLSDKIDPRILTTSGMIMMCIGTLLMISLTEELMMLQVYMILITTGCGYALFSAPNTNVIMSSVSVKNYSESSGVLSLMRQVGMMTSIAVVMCMISVFLGTTTVVTPDVFGEFIQSIRYSFAVCFVLAVIGCFMTWFSKDKNVTPGVSNH